MKAEAEKKQRDDQKGAKVEETLDVGTAGHLSGQGSPLR